MSTTTVFINEFHYDNAGDDAGEFVEIAGPAGTDLSGWSIVRYNGSTPSAATVYSTPAQITSLTGVAIPNQASGFGTVAVSFDVNGLQNGPNDGFALVDGAGIVRQLLSYEGIFTAGAGQGPAAGRTSTDVGVSEGSGTPLGASLQLTGTGSRYEDFRWTVSNDDSPGAVNAGQSFVAPVRTPVINEFVFNHVGTDTNEYIEVFAAPNANLSTFTLLMIEGSGTGTGQIDRIFSLGTADAAGYWTTGFLNNQLENGTETLLLVSGFSGTLNQDLDTNNDGVLEATPWTSVVDGVAVLDTGVGGFTYGGTVLQTGFDGAAFAPGGASRIPNGVDTDSAADWVRNDFDLSGIPGFTGTPAAGEARNTPGAANALAIGPVAGVSVTPTTVSVAEGGATANVSVVLTSAPTAAVTISVAGDAEVSASIASLTFIPANWNVPQTVTVTAVDDTEVEGPHGGTVTFGAAVSADAAYNGLAVDDVAATIADNDAAIVITRIHQVQGPGESSPLLGETVTVEAVVTGDFQTGDADALRNLRGFYLQEKDADADSNPLTSEGIFIFEPGSLTDVNVGDVVRVTGTVQEFFGLTQLSASGISVVSSGNALPTAALINLPAAGVTLNQNGAWQPDLEAFEGMLVEFPQTLTISEQFNLDRSNEIRLVAGDREFQFTQDNDPSVAGFTAHRQALGARTIVYDDGENAQNRPIGNLDGFGPTYNTANAPRMGDQITGLGGVLDYQWAGFSSSGATWRVRSTENDTNEFVRGVNPRPSEVPDVGGDFQVASFNVLNYFTTIDLPGVTTAIGADPRGADTADELSRQREKLLTTLLALSAEIIGLIELENDFLAGAGGNAIEDIVNGLNFGLGADLWSWVDPGTQFVGSDAIAVGFIYRNDQVMLAPGTTVEFYDTGAFIGLGRAPLAASFQHLDSGEVFTVSVNHFKSKGAEGATGANLDQLDGQGAFNAARTAQANELAAWLATDPTGAGDADVLIIGDINAYTREDPIKALEAAGYTNLEPPGAYSFVFDGQKGSLDHALASSSLLSKVTGAKPWGVNADEADALDYNLDFGRDPAIFDGTVPFRASDHDALVIGLDFEPAPVPAAVTFDIFRNVAAPSGERGAWTAQVARIDYRDDTTGGATVADTHDDDAPLAADGITSEAADGDFAILGARFADNLGGRRAGSDPLLTVAWDDSGREATIDLLLPWNSWKNLLVTAFDGDALNVNGFVHVALELGGAEQDLRASLDGVKRADVRSGSGDDEFTFGIHSNGGGNSVVTVDTGAGNDIVRIGPAEGDYSASTLFDQGTFTNVTLGEGDDVMWGSASRRDTAIYADDLAEVMIQAIAGGVRVVTSTEGTDELYGVEFAKFAGTRYAIADFV